MGLATGVATFEGIGLEEGVSPRSDFNTGLGSVLGGVVSAGLPEVESRGFWS